MPCPLDDQPMSMNSERRSNRSISETFGADERSSGTEDVNRIWSAEEEGDPNRNGSNPTVSPPYSPVMSLFVLPFFVANLVFWPKFALGAQELGNEFFGAIASLFGTMLVGFIYGLFIGWRINSGRYGDVEDSLPTLMYGMGQAFWAAISVLAPILLWWACSILIPIMLL